MNSKEALQFVKDRLSGKALKGQRRSSKWSKVRGAHLEKHPECEVCGRKTHVEVHHVMPFSMFPDMELEPKNLITLCENKKNGLNCHLFVGHLGNFKRFNPNAKAMALQFRALLGKLDLNNDI